jgi:hypothetical protein
MSPPTPLLIAPAYRLMHAQSPMKMKRTLHSLRGRRNIKSQSIGGSIGWLAQSTRPDLAPSHSFLSAYIIRPSRSHLNATLYVLHYIHSTIDYGFMFTSAEKAPPHTYMTFPHSSNTKAYNDALPPKTDRHHHLTMYSNACWGSQIGNAVREGIQLPLLKFCSMSSAIIS